MTEKPKRTTAALLAAGILAAALVVMVMDRRSQAIPDRELSWWSSALLGLGVPLQQVLAMPFEAAGEFWGRYMALVGVGERNRELEGVVAQLKDENLQLREALLAGGRLEQINRMRDDFEVPMLPAEIVAVDVSSWFRSVLLGRGRAHGIAAGMPVISEDGLVGVVTTTAPGAAKVKLLLDRQSAADGVVQRSRLRGVVRGGRSGEQLAFEFVARGGDLALGDEIISSGLGGIYPKGLRIGRVVALPEAGPQLLARATLEPAVDFSKLEQVFVMLRRGATLDLLYARDDGDQPVSRP